MQFSPVVGLSTYQLTVLLSRRLVLPNPSFVREFLVVDPIPGCTALGRYGVKR